MTATRRLSPARRPRFAPPAQLTLPSMVASLPRPDVKTLFDFKQKPGYYNAAAQAALLRRAKAAPSDDLLVDFSRTDCLVELRAAGVTLLAGPWSFAATAAGQSLATAGPWQASCWETDDLYDYLEIEQPLSGGWRVERQMLLARRDRFLLLTDALLAPRGVSERVELTYAGSLPLEPGAAFAPASETREGWLESGKKRRASVVPLALPEWRAEFRHADLTSTSGHLALTQRALGQNLYAPLWLDLDPARQRRPLTWRQITVAQNLETITRDAAAAYRVQVGAEQWLIYRSLAPRGNRSFLGHNTHHEFVCRRFRTSGDTEPIIEIE